MTTSEFMDVQDETEAKLRALAAAMQFDVYEGALPTGDQLKGRAGRTWPYVVFGFGGKSEAKRSVKNITTSADDVKWTSFICICVGDTPRTVRKLKDIIRIEFEGYTPRPGWGEFVEVLTGDFGISKPDADLMPLRFSEIITFKSLTDF